MENTIGLIARIFPFLMEGLGVTLMVSLCAIILGVTVGLFLTVLRMTDIGPLKILVRIYVSFMRGTPLLIQIFVIFYALAFTGLEIPAFQSGVIALSLNSGAFTSEILRGGLNAIPKGQYEAAEALGMSRFQILRRIIFPQVFRICIPQLTNEFIAVIKGSPLVSVITVVELTRTAQRFVSTTFQPIPIYLTAAAIYLIVISLLELVVQWQEKKMKLD